MIFEAESTLGDNLAQRICCGISLLAMSIRYSLLASRENCWAAGVCTEEGSELYVFGPQMTHGEASSECI